MKHTTTKRSAIVTRMTAAAAVLAAALAVPCTANAWQMWDAFKASNVTDTYRVIDYSDSRRITTSEGQSYAMFFALVSHDKDAFEKALKWTEDNLASGDITKHKPAWLWGKLNNGRWGIIDTNNATDSDMWIAYSLLEAGRLWQRDDYTAKGKAMVELLKKEVRDVEGLGKVILPAGVGFENEGVVTVNPSYYPVFILRRFAMDDVYWRDVLEGTVRVLQRTAPKGFAPEWAKILPDGRPMEPRGKDYTTGSYNAIRTYLWAGMMSPADPVRKILTDHFAPMARITEAQNMPPETVNIVTGETSGTGNSGFAACVLELLGKTKTADYLRQVIRSEPIIGENYYKNTLMLFGSGFDDGVFRFDQKGRVIIKSAGALAEVKVNPDPSKAKAKPKPEHLAKTEEPVQPVAEPPVAAQTPSETSFEKVHSASEAESSASDVKAEATEAKSVGDKQ